MTFLCPLPQHFSISGLTSHEEEEEEEKKSQSLSFSVIYLSSPLDGCCTSLPIMAVR